MAEVAFDRLVEQSPVALALLGQDGAYKYINPKFQELFGYTLEDLPDGRQWFTKAYPDRGYRKEVITAWIGDVKGLRAGEARARVFTVTCKDGSRKVIQFKAKATDNGDQLLLYEDVTEQRRTEDRICQGQKMEAMGTLAGGIAHDFNNILTPIIVQTEVAMHLLSKDSPVQHNLQEVIKAAHRARELVKQILTFGRRGEQNRLPLKVSPALRETVAFLRSSLPANIEIKEEINVGVDVALIDPKEIHQVMMNLCTNAAQAMKKNGGGLLEVSLVDVEISAHDGGGDVDLEPGPYLKLTVNDTGHGMDQETMKRIFDPFFTTKSRTEGTGMGLAVVHGIVKNWGGRISVQSAPGMGTTFYVFLPRVDSKAIGRTEPAGPVPGGSERILLVDDDKAVMDTVEVMLEYLGYDVVPKLSGDDALKAFQGQPDRFDLVIMDQSMSRTAAKEWVQKLRAIRPGLPVILFAGFTDRMQEEDLKASGISAYLMKPLVMDDMAKVIRKVMDPDDFG
ncbi:MAG: ATP-binding protein [Thermodesulfobacteriota bacterium]|nr:ATP-binding protein [Thermodesulfobacteriota bacterium]